jgi:hypothetical protein
VSTPGRVLNEKVSTEKAADNYVRNRADYRKLCFPLFLFRNPFAAHIPSPEKNAMPWRQRVMR